MKKQHQAPAKTPFYKIMVSEDTADATILLYDYIGEYYAWDPETGGSIEGITDVEFVAELNRLAEKYARIHLRINSPGGDFFHGNAIMTAIQNCKAEVHTWNDGVAASMAADIWLCAPHRHMARNAMLMIHPAWNICIGHAQDMRDCADLLDKISDAAIIATAASIGISEDEMRSRYYADYKDHWLTYNDAVSDGLVNETGEYEASPPAEDIRKMTYKELVDHFQKANHPEAPGLMDRLKTLWEKTLSNFTHKSAVPAGRPTQNTDTNMTIEELKKSIADGTLKTEDVAAVLAAVPPAATPADDDTSAEKLAADLAALKEQNNALADQMKKLEEIIAGYGPLPGANKSQPAKPAGDPPIGEGDDPSKALADFNKAVAEAAGKHDNPYKRVGTV